MAKIKSKKTSKKSAKPSKAKKGKTRASKSDLGHVLHEAKARTSQLMDEHQQMLDGTIRVLGRQNKDLQEQVAALVAENAALRNELTAKAPKLVPASTGAIVGGTVTCVCGYAPEEHGHDAAHPGWTGCEESDCAAYEAAEQDEDADHTADHTAIEHAEHGELDVASTAELVEPAADHANHVVESEA